MIEALRVFLFSAKHKNKSKMEEIGNNIENLDAWKNEKMTLRKVNNAVYCNEGWGQDRQDPHDSITPLPRPLPPPPSRRSVLGSSSSESKILLGRRFSEDFFTT